MIDEQNKKGGVTGCKARRRSCDQPQLAALRRGARELIAKDKISVNSAAGLGLAQVGPADASKD